MIRFVLELKIELISAIEHCRLSKKEKEFQKEGSNRVTEWGVKTTEWKEWLKNMETELDNQGAVGSEPAVVKQQQNELEVNCVLKVAAMSPHH